MHVTDCFVDWLVRIRRNLLNDIYHIALFSTYLPQSITDEQKSQFEELKQLEAEAESHLREVKSKSSTLLQALEEGALLTVAALLKETQQLASQLKHAEEKVKVCLLHGFLFLSFSCSKQLKHQLVLGDVFLHYHENTQSLSHTRLQTSACY